MAAIIVIRIGFIARWHLARKKPKATHENNFIRDSWLAIQTG